MVTLNLSQLATGFNILAIMFPTQKDPSLRLTALPVETSNNTTHPTQPEPTDPYSTLEVHRIYIEQDKDAAPALRPVSGFWKIPSYDNATHKEAVGTGTVSPESVKLLKDRKQRLILGIRRRTFFGCLIAIILIVIAGVGGGLGNRHVPSSTSNSTSNTNVGNTYTNTGLAALQWTDPNGTMYKRVYYQDNNNKIRESAWDNQTTFDTAWEINTISELTKPQTPIAAVAGWPHASYNYSLVSKPAEAQDLKA